MTPPKIFKSEDFNLEQGLMPLIASHGRSMAAGIAQAIFETWLKENSKVVSGYSEGREGWVYFPNRAYEPTHSALLVCLEEIKKPEIRFCSECGKQK